MMPRPRIVRSSGSRHDVIAAWLKKPESVAAANLVARCSDKPSIRPFCRTGQRRYPGSASCGSDGNRSILAPGDHTGFAAEWNSVEQ